MSLIERTTGNMIAHGLRLAYTSTAASPTKCLGLAFVTAALFEPYILLL